VPYSDEINVIIEKAHGESKEFVEWGGDWKWLSTKYKLIFGKMFEETSGSKVKRIVKGQRLYSILCFVQGE